MAITFPLDVPLEFVQEVNFDLETASAYAKSSFTRRIVTQEYEGDAWTLTLGYRGLTREKAQPVLAFKDSLRGPIGTFVMKFPGYDAPLGAAKNVASSPSVNGSGQAGSKTLTIGSATPSVEDWLLEGDIIQVGPASRPHWHRVLTNVDTDSSGEATIDVAPRIREDTLDGDLISYTSPLCLFRLVEFVPVGLRKPVLHTFDLVCEEAI